jgi:hypothetical protein
VPTFVPTLSPELVFTSYTTQAGGSTVIDRQTEKHTIEQELLIWPIVVAGLIGLLLGGLGGYWLGQSLVYTNSTVGPAPAAPIYNTMDRVRHNRIYVPAAPQAYDEIVH